MTITEPTGTAPVRTRGLPRIDPYRLPTAADLPANRVGWTVDADRAVLLVHDMQHYFADAFAPDEHGVRLSDVVATRIGELLGRFRALGAPVVYTAQPPDQSPADRALLAAFWGPGLRDDAQARILDSVAPAPGERVVTKWRYSAFARTDLRALLTELGRDQLVITGIYTHIGCQTTAVDAFMQDVQAFLVADATADFSAGEHHDALSYVARRAGVTATAATVLEQLGTARFTTEQVRCQLAAAAGEAPADLTDDVEIIDSGLDSLRVMALAEQWRVAGLDVSLDDLLERTTIGEWCALVAQA